MGQGSGRTMFGTAEVKHTAVQCIATYCPAHCTVHCSDVGIYSTAHIGQAKKRLLPRGRVWS